MASGPLFSTYRQGENRVTSSMLAVFERIDLALLQSVLAGATGEAALKMVSFTNQPPGDGSVPDGLIYGSFSYWFEVKTARDAIRRAQLVAHMRSLSSEREHERLFVVSPDATQPAVIAELADDRVQWFPFVALSEAIDEHLDGASDKTGDMPFVSEQARFLLRELQALMRADNLLAGDDVVVVAANRGYPEYKQFGAYLCQADRAFRTGLSHMAFYADGEIKPEIPEIEHVVAHVALTRDAADRLRSGNGEHDRRVADLIDQVLDAGLRPVGEPNKIVLLTPVEDSRTRRRTQPISNNATAASGRRVAWTMGQRYARLIRLVDPDVEWTSDLEHASA